MVQRNSSEGMNNLIKGAWGWCDERYSFSSNSGFGTCWDTGSHISLISDKLHCGGRLAGVATVGFPAFHPQITGARSVTNRAGQLRLATRAEPALWLHVSDLWPRHTFPGQADAEEPRGAEPCTLHLFSDPHPEHRLCRSPRLHQSDWALPLPGAGTPQGGRGCQVHPWAHPYRVSRGPEFKIPPSESIFYYTVLPLKVGKRVSFPLLG